MHSSHVQGLTAWVEVKAAALAHNFAEVRQVVEPDTRIMAVVKADAYGHGICGAAKSFADAGADYFGVTTIEEAIEMRSGGVSSPVLIFSPILPDQIEPALDIEADLTIFDLGLAESISEVAERMGRTARVHVKVDTGMARLGVAVEECPEFLSRVANLPGIEIAGTYTHFANSGAKDRTDARRQLDRFAELIGNLKSKGIPTGLCHAANSGALLNLPSSHFDMVRPGTILYGQYPTSHVDKKLELRDTWCLKTRVVALKALPAGTQVGYGSEFTTKRPTIAAVIPVGYAEGFTVVPQSSANRNNSLVRAIAAKLLKGSAGPRVTVRGQKSPVIGRVSMQMSSIDVTDVPGVEIGDEVIVPARRVTTSGRIPRVYVGS